ncbi:hypothetical protein E2R51_04065 [Jeotgalibacillus sp. S-D1]|uniref:hypothetical protein n=1 Tax=Jeotgalibacillus sp. S-D1 TaxID=2552189 RepID=UPI00105979AB|nr:hypothetical protein [Jeotgalibacillus sp. S-D1]TDL34907.1 hypothetical protein E2R51_04065 [Jeotgalibacillus sp. S-D1]
MTKNNSNRTSQKLKQPDRINSDKESILDKVEDEQMTDPVPVEDLGQEMKEEKNKTKTKSTSSSEKSSATKK